MIYDENGQIIYNESVDRLLCYIAFKVFDEMSAGRPLTEIAVELSMDILEEDRIELFEIMDRFESDWTEEIAQLRSLSKRRPEPDSPTPQPTHPPATTATILPFRPEDQPT